MDSFTISLLSSSERDLRKLDRQIVTRVTAAIDTLVDEPRPKGCRKLAGSQLV
jgi:mRNA-degrading endonuclease RelE of RelBE toxin-antitoxin system